MEALKSKKTIRDVNALEAEIIALDNEINQSNQKISVEAKLLLIGLPAEFIGRLTKTSFESKLEATMDLRGRFLPKIFSEILGKTIFKKAGFLNRFLLTKASDFTLAKWLKSKSNLKNTGLDGSRIISTPTPSDTREQWVGDMETTLELAETATKEVKKLNFSGIFAVLKNAFSGFSDHKVTKLSGSLAYYTVFSMAPLMIVVIALMSIFLSREAAEGQIYLQLKDFLGAVPAKQIQDLIKNAAISGKGTIAFVIGVITLLLGATSVFADIQDSINSIWGIKPKPKRGWLKLLKNRFLSFSVIISLGFLLLVSLGISSLLDAFSTRLQLRFSEVSVIIFYILNLALNLVVISAIFGVIFKVLPDADIRWRDVAWGALVTAILFMLGKVGISIYISKTDVGGTFGATGSLVVLLLWTYYSSIILYFGAEFTRAYALAYGAEIHPDSHAVSIKEVEVERGNESLQAIQKQDHDFSKEES
ncbi:YihY/virulence factor BrkB family protein [Pedobacter aquatilis]|uniref:YihY/virulence factor BrkB family protein n=1 Tax=Pedobacter aquatilis TaxID=351343 RepID=UPI0025B4FCB8|nr:YihY/virulence factor BrkB family protein [Pedobacter aquatilis]MDN3586249.1 YihY/virulence factor BrkB family protein [Pedobacter aquatilis]